METTQRISATVLEKINNLEPETLQLGDRGEGVQRLQTVLADLQLFTGAIDGNFGVKTMAAVRLLQRRLGLSETGVFDQESWYGMTFWSNDLSGMEQKTAWRLNLSPLRRAARLFGI